MDFSSANVPLWRFVIQMGIIAFTVILATIIRRKIPLIKKTLIPTSVLAGFILLLIKSTNLLYVDPEFLEMVTYHGIAIGFIALSLRVPKEDKSPGAVRTAINSGALIVSTYFEQWQRSPKPQNCPSFFVPIVYRQQILLYNNKLPAQLQR